ncbi:hypothetical protein ATKI12_1435 [Kitasatospora sp. Ki12]
MLQGTRAGTVRIPVRILGRDGWTGAAGRGTAEEVGADPLMRPGTVTGEIGGGRQLPCQGADSAHSTQTGGHAAQVDRPPLREIRLSLHADDARDTDGLLSSAYRILGSKHPHGGICPHRGLLSPAGPPRGDAERAETTPLRGPRWTARLAERNVSAV